MWPFTLENHDINITANVLSKWYIAIKDDVADNVLTVKIGDWKFIAVWTSLWDASEKIKTIGINEGSYSIIDWSPFEVCFRYRAIVLDDTPMIVKTFNDRATSLTTVYPTLMLYPNVESIWLWMEHKSTGELAKDKNGNVLIDTVGDELLDTFIIEREDDEVLDYKITGATMLEMSTLFHKVNCRNVEFDVLQSLIYSKHMRLMLEGEKNV